jgi:hypothetical protein
MKDNTALEFLFYSYFGVDVKQSKEKLLDAAINKAYADAARHVLTFKKNCELTKETKKKQRTEAREEATQLLKKELNNINEVSNFIKWHRGIIQEICNVYKKTALGFSGGIAQKWINMTIKNIFVINASLNMCNEECEQIKKIVNVLSKCEYDIPVDDYMIAVAKGKGICVPQIDNSIRRWSSWDIETEESKYEICYYTNFQNDIREKFGEEMESEETLLDVENRLWIKEAISRINK